MNGQDNILNLIRIGGLPYALAILFVTFLLSRLLSGVLYGMGQRFADKRLVINQAGSFVRFGIYILGGAGAAATMLVLTREVLLAVGGTVAVSIGFALKDIVASVVAGLVVLIDKPFQVGDRVTFQGYYGDITDIGLRSVRLMTLDDTLVTIPNNVFLTEAVASGNAGSVEMMVQMDFYVGVDQDIAKARQIVLEVLTTSRFVHLKKPWAVLLKQVIHENYVAVQVRAKAYVLDVRFEKAFETDVNERTLQGFREAGIAPPAVLHRSL